MARPEVVGLSPGVSPVVRDGFPGAGGKASARRKELGFHLDACVALTVRVACVSRVGSTLCVCLVLWDSCAFLAGFARCVPCLEGSAHKKLCPRDSIIIFGCSLVRAVVPLCPPPNPIP